MPVLVKYWILGSTACAVAGWVLSTLHQLNGPGYLAFFILAGVAFAFWRHWNPSPRPFRSNATGCRIWMRKLRRRFRRPLPRVFAVAAVLIMLGGALYAPTNYDALMYRFPRLLHWWGQSGWHWLSTPVQGMNRSGAGFEWLMMPIFILTHSDRFFFLINLASFLLMPGLIFSAFRAAGVAKRVAWTWMWLLPMGFCYIMQAGSIGNDIVAVTYVLAAVACGLRAARDGSPEQLRLAFLAAGLATGVKAANLPLLLPMACALWPALPWLRRRPALNAITILVGLLVSFLPTAVLNQKFSGHWAGDPQNLEKMTIQKPWSGIMGNSVQLAVQTLQPPVLPFARPISNALWESVPRGFRASLLHDFPNLAWLFGELPQEEGTGLGLCIAVLCGTALAFALLRRRRPASFWTPATRPGLIIGIAAWLAMLAYMMRIGAPATGRLLAAYYPLLLLPILLHPAQETLVRKRWWKKLGFLAGMVALIPVVLTPSRPLWPGERVFDALQRKFPQNQQIARAHEIYKVYWDRNDVLAPIRQHLPPSASVVGLMEDAGDAETSLWRPYGTRRIVLLTGTNRFQRPNLEWMVVKNDVLGADPTAFAQWLKQTGGILVDQETITELVNIGPKTWSLVRFHEAAGQPVTTNLDFP
jgi:hypothetical protein